jgi:hypothetical protein
MKLTRTCIFAQKEGNRGHGVLAIYTPIKKNKFKSISKCHKNSNKIIWSASGHPMLEHKIFAGKKHFTWPI